MHEFPISSDDCRLLLLLENTGSVREAAQILKRDISVVTRQMARLAEKSGVVEKVNGKWQISSAGHRINAWSRDAILAQQRVLKSQLSLRIVTTREFGARVLAPKLAELTEGETDLQISIYSTGKGSENFLLRGDADLAIDCSRPSSPEIRFKRVVEEPFAVVISPALLGNRKIRNVEHLMELPHLLHQGLKTSEVLKLPHAIPQIKAVFNDIAMTRAAACAGLGWALLPRYAVAFELASKELVEIKSIPTLDPEHFGVWWLRDRPALEPWVKKIASWLARQSL